MRILLTLARIEGAGFTTYCENLSAGLKAAGHEVILLTGATIDCPAKRYTVPSSYRRCVIINRGVTSVTAHIRTYIKTITDLNPDAMIINYSPFVMASLPFIPWHIIRIPAVHSIMEAEVKTSLDNHFWWDRAVCVSPLIARFAQGMPGSTKLHICPLGVPLSTENDNLPRASIEKRPLSLVWAGRVEKFQKRVDLIPLIARELEARKVWYQWTVLGNGSYQNTIIRTLTEMGIADKFRFMGSVPRRQVDAFFRSADVLVMPSDNEGMPQALLESMSLGVVPVVSQIPGSTDYVVRDSVEGFLCKRGVPESFAAKLEELAHNAALLSRMSEAAVKRVSGEFGIHAFADRILSHIRAVDEEGIIRSTPRPMRNFAQKVTGLGCDGLWLATAKQSVKWILRNCLGRQGL